MSKINFALTIVVSVGLAGCGGSSSDNLLEQTVSSPPITFAVPESVSSDLNNTSEFLAAYSGKWKGEIESIGLVSGYIAESGMVYFEIDNSPNRLTLQDFTASTDGYTGEIILAQPFDEETPSLSYAVAVSPNPYALELTLTPNADPTQTALNGVLFPANNTGNIFVEELRNIEITSALAGGTIAISEDYEITIEGTDCEYRGELRSHEELDGIIEVSLSQIASNSCDDERAPIYGLLVFDEMLGAQMIDLSSPEKRKYFLTEGGL